MTTYLLFLNGFFKTRKDIEEFSNDFVEGVSTTHSLKVFIENKESIILIFDSDDDVEILRNNINGFLSKNEIKSSFMFKKDDLQMVRLPEEVQEIIFSSSPIDSILFLEIMAIEKEYNLDEILDKIEKNGIQSLTKDEKKFLDNFKK